VCGLTASRIAVAGAALEAIAALLVIPDLRCLLGLDSPVSDAFRDDFSDTATRWMNEPEPNEADGPFARYSRVAGLLVALPMLLLLLSGCGGQGRVVPKEVAH
jgi:hypothetical protein